MSYVEKPDGSRVAIEWLTPKLTEPGRGRHIRFFELSLPIEMNDRDSLIFAERIIEAGYGSPADTTFGFISRGFTPEDPTRAIVSASVEELVIDMKPSGDGDDLIGPAELALRELVRKHYRGIFEPKMIRERRANARTT